MRISLQFLIILLLVVAGAVQALEVLSDSKNSNDSIEALPVPTLAELITAAELVAVAQLNHTRYEYLREFPNKGVAWLRPLITYKSNRSLDDFTVFDEGVKGAHCYFPDTALWQEGNRYLVFLKHQEFIRYRGLLPTCYLPISVNSDNQYVLRMPLDTVSLPDELVAQTQEYQLTDGGSRIDATELLPREKQEMIHKLQMQDEGDTLVYTRGIPISAVRRYIQKVLQQNIDSTTEAQ